MEPKLTPVDERLLYTDIREGNIVSTEEKRITLAYEGLTDVPYHLVQDYGAIVEILDLSHNKLTQVDFLSSFKNLTTLILDHNYLTTDTTFPHNQNLTTLWLNHNFIDKLHPLIQKLGKSYPNLKFLSLMGNIGAPSYLNGGTYYEYIQYRFFVISWIPQLLYLDDRIITEDQRQEANRLYGRPYFKTLLEEQIPEFMQRIMGKLKGISFGGNNSQTQSEQPSTPAISNNPGGDACSSNFASIPVNPEPVRLNSSDSESSMSNPRRKQRSLII